MTCRARVIRSQANGAATHWRATPPPTTLRTAALYAALTSRAEHSCALHCAACLVTYRRLHAHYRCFRTLPLASPRCLLAHTICRCMRVKHHRYSLAFSCAVSANGGTLSTRLWRYRLVRMDMTYLGVTSFFYAFHNNIGM